MKITLFGSVKPIHLTRDHGAPTDPPNGVRIAAREGFSRGIGAWLTPSHTRCFRFFRVTRLRQCLWNDRRKSHSFSVEHFQHKTQLQCVLCSCFTAL